MTRTIRERVLAWCRDTLIPLIGIAAVSRWEEKPFSPPVPSHFFPQSVWPKAETVIVIDLPVYLPVLETTPSLWYHEQYNTVNRLLDN